MMLQSLKITVSGLFQVGRPIKRSPMRLIQVDISVSEGHSGRLFLLETTGERLHEGKEDNPFALVLWSIVSV